MNDKKNPLVLIVVVVVVVLLAVGVVYSLNKKSDGNNSTGDSMSNMNHSTSDSSSNIDTSKAEETDSVTIENFAYSPPAIKVKVGTKVTWTNKDSVEHNVVGDDLKDLNGKLLKKGESFSYTFDKAGTYSYHCMPHPYMKGVVVVTG
jgi:amicyanin